MAGLLEFATMEPLRALKNVTMPSRKAVYSSSCSSSDSVTRCHECVLELLCAGLSSVQLKGAARALQTKQVAEKAG